MNGYKQYIRTDVNGIVIKGFTSAFEQPIAGDLLLSGQDGRHFQMQLLTDRGQYKYKLVNNQMVERTQAELDAEWAARPAPPKTPRQKEIDKLTADNEQMNLQIIDLFEQLVEKGLL